MRHTAIVLAAAVLLLAGCSAAEPPAPEPPATVTAAETCKQVSAVLTVLQNAGVSRNEERSTDEELAESIARAESMLDDVETEPSSGYEAAVDRLRGASTDEYEVFTQNTGSERWGDALGEVRDLCAADGSELAVEVWTGG